MREKGIGSEKEGKSIGDTVSGTGGDFIKKFLRSRVNREEAKATRERKKHFLLIERRAGFRGNKPPALEYNWR